MSESPESNLPKDRLVELEAVIAEGRVRLEQSAASAFAIEDARRQVAVGVEDVQSKVAQMSALLTEALAAKTQIVADQTVIATRSEHIEQAQIHADNVRGELDRQLTAAKQQATDAEAFKARAQSAADTATEHLGDTKLSKATAEAERDDVQRLASEVDTASKVIKGLSSKAAMVEQRLEAYEQELERLRVESDGQLATIVGLLPGATSAGLAHAFHERRQSFLKPGLTWQWVFVSSVGLLVLLALSGLAHVYKSATPLTYDELFRLWLARLPIAISLIWLALYASKEAALAKRLEEDYGYKAAIAASFQGFHRQMSELAEAAGPNTPLSILCTDTLATIASPPGRIYDKPHVAITPASESVQLMREVVDPASAKPGAAKQ